MELKEKIPKTWIGPVVIGGVGGSGTRLIARLLRLLNFYTGPEEIFNESDDNLYFSRLFLFLLRLIWEGEEKTKIQIHNAISIFEKAMLSPVYLSDSDLERIFRYAYEMGDIVPKPDMMRPAFRLLNSNLFLSMLRPKKIHFNGYLGWGWKEPCSYIYLKYLNEYFSDLRYIHVIRHGLDMAFSSNTTHLRFFGWLYGLKVASDKDYYPMLQLKLWNRANKSTIETAQKLLGTNFLLLRFEDVCFHPEKTIEIILDFLGIVPNQTALRKFKKMVKIPNTLFRYKKHNISHFDPEDIEKVKDFGYSI